MREVLCSMMDLVLIGAGFALQGALVVLGALIAAAVILGGFCLIGNLVDWLLRAFVY